MTVGRVLCFAFWSISYRSLLQHVRIEAEKECRYLRLSSRPDPWKPQCDGTWRQRALCSSTMSRVAAGKARWNENTYQPSKMLRIRLT